jgi:hypothetical protein
MWEIEMIENQRHDIYSLSQEELSWRSSKQELVATSTMYAEFIACK